MSKYTVYATLDIRVSGEGESEQDVLDKAIANKDYKITGVAIGSTSLRDYISIKEYARRNNYADDGVYLRTKCREGRIPSAIKVGRDWCIPADIQMTDMRYKSGKYSGQHEKYYKRRGTADKDAQDE